MSLLVKKEIRLLLPAWTTAMLLALVQAGTRPYDFYVACLLFFGLTIMALTPMGREAGLNTFSLMLAQPAERMRIWQAKLSVLVVAFLTVLGVWFLAFLFTLFRQAMSESDLANTWYLFITVCLIATATFTGGLWTTLLVRQLAAAFWLTLLIPATLSGFTAGFLASGHSDNGIIAVLCVVFAVYSIGGFLFARRLFFRAQDIGWSGGIIALPDWKLFAVRPGKDGSARTRKPIYALVKKELLLHQASLMAAAGLLVLQAGVILLRLHHKSDKGSAGDLLTVIFWMFWLVLPVIIGSLAVAEERRLGVMDGQLCLPVSRRVQFVLKSFLALGLGVFLGGLMPVLMELLAAKFGLQNPVFRPVEHGGQAGLLAFEVSIVAIAGWLALVGFYASTLARNFLQAVGLAIVAFFVSLLFIPLFTNNRMILFDTIPPHSVLPLIVTVPVLTAGLLWLGYLNFKNFRDGWPLWRRNLLGFAGILVVIVTVSAALYNRVWEVFEPVEPAHGPARLSLTARPALNGDFFDNLLIRLPDGRVGFDHFEFPYDWPPPHNFWRHFVNPMPRSTGPWQFLAGSNWVSAVAGRMDGWIQVTRSNRNETIHVDGHLDTAGIQSDGTLWISEKSNANDRTAGKMVRFGNETDWQQVGRSYPLTSVLLLKKGGTLWHLGTNYFDWADWPQQWPGLRAFRPYQIGTNSDWAEMLPVTGSLVRKTDDSVWNIWTEKGKDRLSPVTNLDQLPLSTLCRSGAGWDVYVRTNGTLWTIMEGSNGILPEHAAFQIDKETNWISVAAGWGWMVALKSDGTLWQWDWHSRPLNEAFPVPGSVLNRLGIHNDWVALCKVSGGAATLAADGSVWFWPDRDYYAYSEMVLRLPKQPQFLGNLFGRTASNH